MANYTFTLIDSKKNSYRMGNCDYCGGLIAKVYVATKYRNEQGRCKPMQFAVDSKKGCKECLQTNFIDNGKTNTYSEFHSN